MRILSVLIFGSILIPLPTSASFSPRKTSFPLSKPCDKPCLNGGACIDGTCQCLTGWTGQQCENCLGRLRKTSRRGFISDGPMQYGSSSKCIWLIEADGSGSLLLKFEEFFTECCWDNLYVYDGDGVFGDLLGAFSGSVANTELIAKSGKAIVYFVSDVAFNLPGFNISYERGACLNNCSGHGRCLPDGSCQCEDGFRGGFCQHRTCLNDPGKASCHNGGTCHNGKCSCPKHVHGDSCQELILNPVWDNILANGQWYFSARASHKSVLVKESSIIWTFGGFTFGSGNEVHKTNDLVAFYVSENRFEVVKSMDSKEIPAQRHDHSMVYRKGKLYIFGGIINNTYITNEFWSYDIASGAWEKLSAHDLRSTPLAVFGHSAVIIGDEMHCIFGYNVYDGFVYRLQIYSFVTQQWRFGTQDSSIVGRFGHSSVMFEEEDKSSMVLVYGGYIASTGAYPFLISDELLLYDPSDQTWTSLGNTGVPLFRHSAVLIDGIMHIMGGNSHNESSSIRKNDCYSNAILSYDTVCKKWLKISTAEFPSIARYGHEAVAVEDKVYVIGGFNGQMLNDLIRFSSAKCDSQASDAEECENFANGVRCIYQNKTCTKRSSRFSFRQPFASLIKGEPPRSFQMGCQTKGDPSPYICSTLKICSECAQKNGCGWCENIQTCLNSGSGCESDLIYEVDTCPYDGSNSKVRKIRERPRPCSLSRNCYACRKLNHCSWFMVDSKHICVSLDDEAVLIEEHKRLLLEQQNASVIQKPLSQFASTEAFPSHNSIMSSLAKSSSSDVNSTCHPICSMYSTCQECTKAQCMWCSTMRRCVPTDTYMIFFPYGHCQSWVTSSNNGRGCEVDPYDCSVQKTCSDCQSIGPRCGWCDDGSGTGLGKCIAGTNSGPLEKHACLPSRWFFTGEPICQCNGHSICDENFSSSSNSRKKCRECGHRTRGEHCEQCDIGFYGDSRNGGTCRECQCNGQATTCNHQTGDCYCFTKGVTGPRCERCEQKYIGDPKNNKTCTYELIVDFIFTFKLDAEDERDRFATQINFFSIPYKRDVDVQFSISCDGDSGARVSIHLSTESIHGHYLHSKQLMAAHICTINGIKRTYSATDPGFPFGTDANTTFYVKVSDFATPMKIVISFAQSPPINWILFFVIFAACFIILLVVAGLLWMIKLRVEWYRNIRRRNDEIIEMASRPMASVYVDLSKSNPNPEGVLPISIEPCRNYRAGIYTIIVQLPTGGQGGAQQGSSGLALASSLCHLTPTQLAVLQPMDIQKQNNQKSVFRRIIPFIRI